MKAYQSYLEQLGHEVRYVESHEKISDVRQLIPYLKDQDVREIHYVDVTDNWLGQRIESGCAQYKIELTKYASPLFLNTIEDNKSFFRSEKKKFFQTKFYIEQRNKYKLLLDKNGKPLGGKWSYDADNRKKYPKGKTPPPIQFPDRNKYHDEAVTYVNKEFSDHPGQISDQPYYPIDHSSSEEWLDNFLSERFLEFGPYEDAIVQSQSILHHSVLTPMLNVGLLTPAGIIRKTIDYSGSTEIPLNSVEGFVRQIIGWREFIRGVYECKGTEERTRNFWGFTRKIPNSFYNGTTGIFPVDHTIKKVLATGYCHHIERLMILGNFMLLCEFDPDEVYRWFMELFIDAYDWVMVPNVYGMSQFADGGLMSTKPYISGSNYILKMSDYKKGPWQKIWDGLFWRFMHVNRDFFLSNPRLGMLVRMYDKMPVEKQQAHIKEAEDYLGQIKSY